MQNTNIDPTQIKGAFGKWSRFMFFGL
jgi:hypothetical protein